MTIRHYLGPATLAAGAALAAVTIAGFVLVPAGAILPIHWGIDGNVDATMPRDFALLLLPLAGLVVWAIFLAVDRFASPIRAEGGRFTARAVLPAMLGLFLVIQVGIVAAGLGYAVDMVRLASAAVAVLLIILGNVMPKSQPNSFAGLRIPTTLSDAANWQATHRLTGMLLIAGGVALAVGTAFLPGGPALVVCLLAAIFVPIAIGVAYSLNYARRSRA